MKKFNFFYLLLAGLLTFSLTSCEEEDLESCDNDDYSEDFGCPTDVEILATFCTDGINNSYYQYEGDVYECDGIDVSTCDAALDALAIDVIEDHPECATKKSGDFTAANYELSKMAETLLEEVRIKSLCN